MEVIEKREAGTRVNSSVGSPLSSRRTSGAGLARGSQDHAPLAHGEKAKPAVSDERPTT